MKNAKEFLQEKQISVCVGTMNDWIVDTSEGEVAMAMEQYARAYHEDILRLESEGKRVNNQPLMDGVTRKIEHFLKERGVKETLITICEDNAVDAGQLHSMVDLLLDFKKAITPKYLPEDRDAGEGHEAFRNGYNAAVDDMVIQTNA
jgi:hypothetical protein